MNFKLGFCHLCAKPMRLDDVKKAVTWQANSDGWWFGKYWVTAESDGTRVCHKHCWDALHRGDRKKIRKHSHVRPYLGATGEQL